jgi:hypothetical protein
MEFSINFLDYFQVTARKRCKLYQYDTLIERICRR